MGGLLVTALLRRRKQRRHIGAATATTLFQKTWESDEEEGEGEDDTEDGFDPRGYDDDDSDAQSSEIYGIEIDNEAANVTEEIVPAKRQNSTPTTRGLADSPEDLAPVMTSQDLIPIETPQNLTPAVTMEESEVSGFTETSSFRTSGSRSYFSTRSSRRPQPRDPIAHIVDPTRSFITADSIPFPDEATPEEWDSVVHELQLAEGERYVHQPSPPQRKGYKLPDTMAL